VNAERRMDGEPERRTKRHDETNKHYSRLIMNLLSYSSDKLVKHADTQHTDTKYAGIKRADTQPTDTWHADTQYTDT
jgi:hypothetical protein